MKDTSNKYLTIVALEDGLTASLSINACEYCIDGSGIWETLAAGTATEVIDAGQTLSFRGELSPNSSNGIGTFTISKRCNLEGNCMSLLFGDNASDNLSLVSKNSAFYRLFYNCTSIINVSSDFLPATKLGWECYRQMFWGCISLTTAPELPATKLVDMCYEYMFYGCSNLNYIKMLATDISASYCLEYWVYGVASSGTFVKNPAMTSLPTGKSGIPSGWTVENDGEESVNLITFTVSRIEYQAEEGMTWSEWCSSEYNIDGFEERPGFIQPDDSYDMAGSISLSGNYVSPTDIIIENADYILIPSPV